MQPLVRRLIDLIGLTRGTVTRHVPDLLPSMRPLGAEWDVFARGVGIPCPASFIELADAMADCYIDIRGWLLETPTSAQRLREFFARSATEPGLIPLAGMLPLFVRDGDEILLAADGRIHTFEHDGCNQGGVVAPDFDALLSLFVNWLERPGGPGPLRA